jgi:sulfur carrier protein ThiS
MMIRGLENQAGAERIRITLKLFATLARYLPDGARRNQIGIDVASPTTVNGVIETLHMPPELVSLVVLNGEILLPGERASRRFVNGDVLAIWPPVAGG